MPSAAESCPPVFIVHHIEHARAAMAAAAMTGRTVWLLSAPGAARFGGALWFREMIAAARAAFPAAQTLAILDCGREAGTALGAMRAGVEAIRISGAPGPAGRRLESIAESCSVRILHRVPKGCLDLSGRADPQAAALAFLEETSLPGGKKQQE